MIRILNNSPKVKDIRFAHIIRANLLGYDLTAVLKNSYQSFVASDDYMRIAVLPDNVKPNSQSKNSSDGSYWSHSIKLDINEQSNEILEYLNRYNNFSVICCLETRDNEVYIYGNSNQPLNFLYKFSESTNNMDNIGYEISMTGDTYGSPKIITTTDFYKPVRLSSWLASPL